MHPPCLFSTLYILLSILIRANVNKCAIVGIDYEGVRLSHLNEYINLETD